MIFDPNSQGGKHGWGGAHWIELYNSGDEATRGILRYASGVRAELLGEMAGIENDRAEAKQPPRAMKM